METTTIARPYADAVFKLAEGEGKLAEWSGLVRRLAAIAADPNVTPLLGDPKVTSEQIYDLIASAAGDLPAAAQSFIRVLIENDRVQVLPEVTSLFESLKNEHEGVVEATIESAFPLEDAQRKEVIDGLERRFQRRVQPSVVVNHDLIGGVRIAVGDEVIDSSVRGRLTSMAIALAKV
jgi:F-type H+-transporting ATPase subunit delta